MTPLNTILDEESGHEVQIRETQLENLRSNFDFMTNACCLAAGFALGIFFATLFHVLKKE